jgi:hypothetical protein
LGDSEEVAGEAAIVFAHFIHGVVEGAFEGGKEIGGVGVNFFYGVGSVKEELVTAPQGLLFARIGDFFYGVSGDERIRNIHNVPGVHGS